MTVSSLFRSSVLETLALTFCSLLMLTDRIFSTQARSGDIGGQSAIHLWGNSCFSNAVVVFA